MTHKEAINLFHSLNNVTGIDSFKINYAIQKNISLLQKEIDILAKQEKEISEITKEFNLERVALCEEYSKVDGVAVIEKDNYKLVDKKAFEKDFEKLKVKHKVEIDLGLEREKEYQEFLNEVFEFVPYHILISDIPENISTENTKAIFHLIKE